jgi:hypothetical protein
MAITDRNLTAGTKLAARYKGTMHEAEVVQTEEGLRYQLSDGRSFKSLSSVATAITGKSANGWSFWSLASEVTTTSSTIIPAPKPTRRRKLKAEATPEPALPIVEQVDGTYECGECSSAFESREAVEAHLAEFHPA